MSVPNTTLTDSFDEWRISTNTVAASVGDFALIYDVGQTTVISALNNLNTRKANLAGDTFTGAVQINNTLGATGTSTLAAINASGNIVVGSNKVTMNATSGNTVVAGTLDVAGITGLSTVNISGATAFTLSPTAATPSVNDNSTKLATTAYYVGQAGTANPVMNGTVAVGTSHLFSRQDHVHASDTSRLTVLNPSATGTLTVGGGTVTASTPLLSATQTWNNAGVAFKGITINVTNTASSATSLLLDFQLAGVPKFGIDVNGAVFQKLTGSNLSRDVVSGSRHIREYQDLNDSNVQGLDGAYNEWGYTWNAKWDTSEYLKDRNNAGDHAIMQRLTNGYKQQVWFSDGTAPGVISWVKKIDLDIPASTYTFDGSIYVGLLNTSSLITTSSITVGSVTSLADYEVTTSTTSSTTLATIDATIFRSATFEVQAFDATSGKYHKTLISAIHNGSVADYTEYGAVAVLGTCGTFAVTKSGNALLLTVVPASTNTTVFKIHARLMEI